jgi:hypothetical protein
MSNKEQVSVDQIRFLQRFISDNSSVEVIIAFDELLEEYERLKRLWENVKKKMAYLKDLESRNDLTEYSYAQLKLLESLDK